MSLDRPSKQFDQDRNNPNLVFDASRYRLLVSRYHSGQFFNQTPFLKTEDAVTKDLSQNTMCDKHDCLSRGAQIFEYPSFVLRVQSRSCFIRSSNRVPRRMARARPNLCR